MYAVIQDSGTQFKVSTGDIIRVDLRDIADDQIDLTFDQVLLVGCDETGTKIGTPTLDGASVTGEIMAEEKGEKVRIVKFRRRKGYRRKTGHRQKYLRVKITGINA